MRTDLPVLANKRSPGTFLNTSKLGDLDIFEHFIFLQFLKISKLFLATFDFKFGLLAKFHVECSAPGLKKRLGAELSGDRFFANTGTDGSMYLFGNIS